MDKPHWFPFFTNDFLASSKIAVMSTEEIGAYVLLLCHAWNDPDCSLSDDDPILIRLGRFSGDISRVRACFIQKNGRLVNERLEKEWKKYQEIHYVRSLASRKANNVRWGSQTDRKRIAKTSPLKSKSKSQLDKEEDKRISASHDLALAQRFEHELWTPYPMRDGKKIGKAVALLKYKRLSGDDLALIAIAVRHLAEHPQSKKGIGIKDAHRWIMDGKNNEPWREWIEATKPTGGIHVGLNDKDYKAGTW